MESQKKPRFWDEFAKLESGLPFVVLSWEKVLDWRYHSKETSRHRFFELSYVQNGEATFEIAGNRVPVAKKDFVIIKPMQPHRLIIDKEKQCTLISLQFNFKKTDTVYDSSVSLEDFLYYVGKENFGAYIRLSSKYKTEIVSALNRITLEMKKGGEDSEFLCSIIVMELFVWLSRALKNEWEKSVNKNLDKLREMMETSRKYILDHYNEDVGLTDIANYVYLSPSHFARVFKSFFGVSAIQCLLSKRVEKARELLLDTDMKICDIAYSVGFSAQQRFNDIFKKHTNMSPSEYRRRAGRK